MSDPMLILVAPGSRDDRWRGSVHTLARRVADQLPGTEVRVAFMQFEGPTIKDVVEQAVEEGYRNLRLLPLFVASAGHVDKDIAPMVEELAAARPGVTMDLMTPVGEDDLFPAFIKDVYSRLQEPD